MYKHFAVKLFTLLHYFCIFSVFTRFFPHLNKQIYPSFCKHISIHLKINHLYKHSRMPRVKSRAAVRKSHAAVGKSHAAVRESHAAVKKSHAAVGKSHAAVKKSHAAVGKSHAAVRESHAAVEKSHAADEEKITFLGKFGTYASLKFPSYPTLHHLHNYNPELSNKTFLSNEIHS